MDDVSNAEDRKDAIDTLLLLNPENCSFSKDEAGLLRVEVHDKLCARQVILKRLFPRKLPDKFISVSDGKNEVGIIEELKAFDHETRKMIESELDYYYAVPVIKQILSIKHEYGFYNWQVFTDRGKCEFYVKGRSETVKSTLEGEVSVTDINNCRYMIKDISKLSPSSKAKINEVL